MSVIHNVKTQVLSQMNELTTNLIHKKEESKILIAINECLVSKNSISILIVGTDDRYLFVETVLNQHKELRKAQRVTLNGIKCNSDSHAMQQIYDAFLFGSSRNPTQVLEDLESYFKVYDIIISWQTQSNCKPYVSFFFFQCSKEKSKEVLLSL